MRDASQSLGGYIRLYRSLLEWEWFQDSTTLHVFLFLLLSACFKPIRHAGVELAPGQLITARRQIAARTGLSERQVRTALDHLKSTHDRPNNKNDNHVNQEKKKGVPLHEDGNKNGYNPLCGIGVCV